MTYSPLMVNGILLLVAFLWGLGFAPQRLGMEYMDAMAFNAWRFGFGALTLLPLFYFLGMKWSEFKDAKAIVGGLILGILLCGGAGLQQISIGMTKVANVAFITGFYVILVPVLGMFVRHKYPLITWIGGVLALVGLALLSGFNGELSMADQRLQGDIVALVGALFWALHLLSITYFVAKYNQYVLAFYQFVFCALISVALSFTFEERFMPGENMGYVWALLNGILVVGIAYTLQVIALKHAKPFVAAVIFSLESVFGALVGFWFFEEVLGFYGLMGAMLMLFGCVLSQWPEAKSKPPVSSEAR